MWGDRDWSYARWCLLQKDLQEPRQQLHGRSLLHRLVHWQATRQTSRQLSLCQVRLPHCTAASLLPPPCCLPPAASPPCLLCYAGAVGGRPTDRTSLSPSTSASSLRGRNLHTWRAFVLGCLLTGLTTGVDGMIYHLGFTKVRRPSPPTAPCHYNLT